MSLPIIGDRQEAFATILMEHRPFVDQPRDFLIHAGDRGLFAGGSPHGGARGEAIPFSHARNKERVDASSPISHDANQVRDQRSDAPECA